MPPEFFPQAQGRIAAHFHQRADGDGERPVYVGTLGQVGYFSRRVVQGASVPQDFSGIGADQPGQSLDLRGFSCTVGTHQSQRVAAGDGKADAVEREKASIINAEAVHFQSVAVRVAGVRAPADVVLGAGRGWAVHFHEKE